VDKVKGFGEADAFPSDEAEARWIWPEFTRPFGFPAGGQPLCQAASDDGKTSTSPPSAWIVSPSGNRISAIWMKTALKIETHKAIVSCAVKRRVDCFVWGD